MVGCHVPMSLIRTSLLGKAPKSSHQELQWNPDRMNPKSNKFPDIINCMPDPLDFYLANPYTFFIITNPGCDKHETDACIS